MTLPMTAFTEFLQLDSASVLFTAWKVSPVPKVVLSEAATIVVDVWKAWATMLSGWIWPELVSTVPTTALSGIWT